jgi:hypothetical protein
MDSFGTMLSASLKETKKNFFAIAGVCLLANFISSIPTFFFQDTPIMIFILLIPIMIFNMWALIAIYQIMTESKFDLNWQLKRFEERFWKWAWGNLAAIHSVFKSFFPFFFPAFKESMSLMMTSNILLFGTDDRIDALAQSKAMLEGLKVKLFFFLVICIGLIPQGIIKLFKMYGDETFAIPVSALVTGIAATVSTPFLITIFLRRSAQIPFAPSAEPLNYKKMSLSMIPRALGGLAWMTLIIVMLIVGLVFLFKGIQPPLPQPN